LSTWRILKVAPCSEFKVRDALTLDLGLSAYVPVEFKVQRYSGNREGYRRRVIIGGYVFAAIDDWAALEAIREVKGAIFADGRPATLTGSQIAAIEALSQPYKQQRRRGWSAGDKARIKRGQFAELQAIIDRIDKGKIITVVEMFGKQHALRLDPDQLEAA